MAFFIDSFALKQSHSQYHEALFTWHGWLGYPTDLIQIPIRPTLSSSSRFISGTVVLAYWIALYIIQSTSSHSPHLQQVN